MLNLKILLKKVKIGKLNFTKVDFNLVKKGVEDTEIVQFQKVLSSTLSGFDNAKKGRFIERMLLMDDYTKNQYFNNLDDYASGFEVGGKYNNLQRKLNGKQYQLEKVGNDFIISNNGIILDGEDYLDYVVLKDGNILFGESHSFLSNGENVIYAGGVELYNGEIKFWNCFSGHYKPQILDKIGKNSVKNYFLNEYNIDLNSIEFTGVSTSEYQTGFFTY